MLLNYGLENNKITLKVYKKKKTRNWSHNELQFKQKLVGAIYIAR